MKWMFTLVAFGASILAGCANSDDEDLPSHVFQTDGGTRSQAFELSEDDAKKEGLKVEFIPFVKVEGKIYLAAVTHQIAGTDFLGKLTLEMQRVYGIHDLDMESKYIYLPSSKYSWDITPASLRVTEHILLVRESGINKAPWKVITIPEPLTKLKVLRIPRIEEIRTLGNSSEDDIAIVKILDKGVEKVKIKKSTK
jgi:hypothetical protein